MNLDERHALERYITKGAVDRNDFGVFCRLKHTYPTAYLKLLKKHRRGEYKTVMRWKKLDAVLRRGREGVRAYLASIPSKGWGALPDLIQNRA